MASRVPTDGNGSTPVRGTDPRLETPAATQGQRQEERTASAAQGGLRSLAEVMAEYARAHQEEQRLPPRAQTFELYSRYRAGYFDDDIGVAPVRSFSRLTPEILTNPGARRHLDFGPTQDPADAVIAQTFDESLLAASRARDARTRTNQDGGAYLEAVVREHLNTLSDTEKKEFEEKLTFCDPEIFFVIPRLAVNKALSSSEALTRGNTPQFMHGHLAVLRELQEKKWDEPAPTPEQAKAIRDQIDKIVTALARHGDCIASIQNAIEKLMKKSEEQSSEKS